ncbi:MAG: TolC family protein [Cytophagaceae bacterium]|nr:TolC family protein [Cytophagaceae bacterium]
MAQITEQEAIDEGLKNHPQMQLSAQQIEQQRALKKGSYNFNNPDIWLEGPTSVQFAVGVQQIFDFPTVYANQARLGKENVTLAEKGSLVNVSQLKRDIRVAFQNLQYSYDRVVQLRYQDSIYQKFSEAASRRFNAGEAPLIEKINSEARYKEVHNNLLRAELELMNAQNQLRNLTGIVSKALIPASAYEKLNAPVMIDTASYDTLQNPLLNYYRQSRIVAGRNLKLERSRLAPGLMVGYLNQGFSNSPVLYRFRLGITVPVWFWTYNSRIRAANIGTQIAQSQYLVAEKTYTSTYQQAVNDYRQNQKTIMYYEETALKQSDLIVSTSERSYASGIIDFMTYMLSLNQAFEIKLGYYDAIRNYNNAVIQLNYLKGE